MRLPFVPASYSPRREQDRNRAIEQADRDNLKRGEDIEVGSAELVLTGDDGLRYAVRVVAGSLTVVQL